MSIKGKNWHLKYNSFVRGWADETCQSCKRHLVSPAEGVVHHKTYIHKKGIYSATAKELIDDMKITYLCHDCHRYEHETNSIDGVTSILDYRSERYMAESSRCEDCGEAYTCYDQKICDTCVNIRRSDIDEYVF